MKDAQKNLFHKFKNDVLHSFPLMKIDREKNWRTCRPTLYLQDTLSSVHLAETKVIHTIEASVVIEVMHIGSSSKVHITICGQIVLVNVWTNYIVAK